MPKKTLDHIKYLSETIGGRGSCTQMERKAADYVAGQLETVGLERVNVEKFTASPSTYRPFAMAFSTALIGTILAWIIDEPVALLIGSVLNALGAWGMLAETDISPSWMRRLLPKGESQNVIAVIPAARKSRKKAILCAHVDTHRTPVFYSSTTWHKLFGYIVAAALMSILATSIVYGLGVIFGWDWVRWIGLALAPMVIFSLSMCLHADLTPFSPGANDNATGVAVVLGLAEKLLQAPLRTTDVWFVFTGCEEVGAYGMQVFLDRHAAPLGDKPVFIILDEVGIGSPKILISDGIIRKHQTHPQALKLAQKAASALPEIDVLKKTGIAYTDALAATKRGFISLSIGSHSDRNTEESSHWHQMSDTVETIRPETLGQVQVFTWKILEEIDRWSPAIYETNSVENDS